MKLKMRIARASNDLVRISEMYQRGLELPMIGSFKDHDGFDGVILGAEAAGYHLEFTQQKGSIAPRSPSPENLLVFYVPDIATHERLSDKMGKAGFIKVHSHNPYWTKYGSTFEDPEGYRVILCHLDWTAN